MIRYMWVTCLRQRKLLNVYKSLISAQFDWLSYLHAVRGGGLS